MPKVKFGFVPSGGGEQEYMAEVDMLAIPRSGESVHFPDPEQVGLQRSFLVRSVNRYLYCENALDYVAVVSEFVEPGWDSEHHLESIHRFARTGKVAKKIQPDGY